MPLIHTYSGQKLLPYQRADLAREQPVKLAASQTLVKGTVIAQRATTDLWEAYSDAGSDGLNVARAILAYDIVTDASGNHFMGLQASSEFGESSLYTSAYFSGDFKVSELTGLDANGLADMQGFIRYGDNLADANAVIHIG